MSGRFVHCDPVAQAACSDRGADAIAYRGYVAECEEENLEAHTRPMWVVHGRPTGPLGGQS